VLLKIEKGADAMPNLTLAISEDLLKKARQYAVEQGTSVNALIRAYLEELVEKQNRLEEAADELLKLSETYGGCMEPWSRDDLYEP
jgi:hypothetical protein